MEEEVLGLDEGDGVTAEERERAGFANGGDGLVDSGGIHGVGGEAGEAKEDGAVGAVTDAGERERAVEIDEDVVGAVEVVSGVELAGEAEGGAHGTDGVRGGGADANLEELEEAGVHLLILGLGFGARWVAGCDFGVGLRSACLALTLL